MKFEKYLKSIGGHGIIFKNGTEQWLASQTVFALIPDYMNGIVAKNIVDMPEPIKKILDADLSNDPCELVDAIMPYPNGGIKDCIRVFATENKLYKIKIRNNDYALIEKGDFTEIHTKLNNDTMEYEVKALIVKKAETKDNLVTVGIIFPTHTDMEDVVNG